MSGVLKKHKKLFIVGILILILECLMAAVGFFWPIFMIADIIGCCFLCVDYKVYKMFYSQMKPFEQRSIVRNVDYLVIGEPGINIVPDGSSSVAIKVPNVSEEGAYQILRRTHSILKQNGNVIIMLDKKNVGKKNVGLIETIFLHPLTIQELNLDKLQKLKRLVLFFKPKESCRLLLGLKHENFVPQKIRGGVLI